MMSPLSSVFADFASLFDARWPALLLAKMTCLLSIAWMIHFAIGGVNLRWRVVLWRVVAVGLIGLAVLDASRWFTIPVAIISPSENVRTTRRLASETISTAELGNAAIAKSPRVGPMNVGDVKTLDSSSASKDGFGMPESLSEVDALVPIDATKTRQRVTTPPTQGDVSWRAVAWFVWSIGVFIALVRLGVGLWKLDGVVRRSDAAADDLQATADGIAHDLSTTSCRIRISDDVRSPLLCGSMVGWAIVIPRSTVSESDDESMRAILTHELSHKRSHDLPWQLSISMVTSLLWPHPLVWWMRTVHLRACEDAADAESARRLGGPAVYVRTLAGVALRATRPDHSAGLAMARGSDIVRRLEKVQTSFRQLPLSRRRISLLAGLGLAVSMGLGAFQLVRAETPQEAQAPMETDDATESDSQTASPRPLIVRVLDPDGQPMKDSEFRVGIDGKNVDFEALGDGRYRVDVPKDAMYLRLRASAPGRVPMVASWRESELERELPPEFAFELPPGTTASGRVIDESGEPIEDANVYLLVITDKSQRQQVDLYRHLVKTNKDGVWTCEIMPAKFNDVWIRLTHPDYISDGMFGETAGQVSIAEIRDGSHTMVMKPGVTVRGTVTGPDGQPISNAIVFQGSDRFGSEYPKTETNQSGTFEFKHSKLGEMVLTVYAKGFAPDLMAIDVTAEMTPVEFKLQRGGTLKVRAVGPDGKPLAGAMVAADTWRNHRSLCDLEIPRETDEDGWLVWEDAPADGIQFDILARGFMDNRGVLLRPREEPHIIEFHRPLRVRGSVVDDSSGEPVKAFRVVPGIEWNPDGQVTWERRNTKSSSGGSFELTFGYPRPGHAIRIEAEGYLPVQSRTIRSDEGEVELEFRLTPAVPITGVVVTPDGKPAMDADVAIAISNQYVGIFNGRLQRASDQIVSTTDADGRFSLPSQEEPFMLLVLHDSGCRLIKSGEFKTGMSIELEPWATIRGTVMIGSEPARQTGLHLGMLEQFAEGESPANRPRVSASGQAKSDDQGRFTFTRVIPNQTISVSRIIRRSNNQQLYTHSQRIQTQPGETHDITIGSGGRPVVGKVVVPDDTPPHQWSFSVMQSLGPTPDWPEELKEASADERKAWYAQWLQSEDGQAMRAFQPVFYAVLVGDDGRFRVEDVPPGKYQLSLSLTAATATKNCQIGESLGSLNRMISVPETVDEQPREPFDLGTLEIKLRNFLDVGDVAPDFTMTKMDGSEVALSDLRGRFVLVDFWATWCGPCIAEMPNLKAAHDRFADNQRFAILSVSLDQDIDTVKKYLRENPLDWMQAHLGEQMQSEVQREFGIIGIPATFLIDPQGKIAAMGLRGDNLPSELERLIAE